MSDGVNGGHGADGDVWRLHCNWLTADKLCCGFSISCPLTLSCMNYEIKYYFLNVSSCFKASKSHLVHVTCSIKVYLDEKYFFYFWFAVLRRIYLWFHTDWISDELPQNDKKVQSQRQQSYRTADCWDMTPTPEQLKMAFTVVVTCMKGLSYIHTTSQIGSAKPSKASLSVKLWI